MNSSQLVFPGQPG